MMHVEHCQSHERHTEDISKMKTQIAINERLIDAVDERVTKHKQETTTITEAIFHRLDELRDAIIGTPDKKGIKTIVMEHEDFLQPQKLALNSIVNWIYKGAMLCGMALIMYLTTHKQG